MKNGMPPPWLGKTVALADFQSAPGTRLPASSLVYTWRLGNRVLTDSSGIGKSTLLATAPVRYRNADITVTVTSPDNSLVGEAATQQLMKQFPWLQPTLRNGVPVIELKPVNPNITSPADVLKAIQVIAESA